MRNNFRQGIISYQKDGNGAPQFLRASQTAGFVQLNVAPSPTLITFAHGDADYLTAFDQSNATAWGPLITSFDNYLYWDMDNLTGAVTQGITTLEPITSSIEPSAPANGQHWFDLNAKKMKVWNAAQLRWTERIRLFAGLVENGNSSQITPKQVGSQVGLNTVSNPGYIMLDSQLHPLRTSDGSFLTSDTRVRIKTTVGTSGVLATPPNAFIPVRAGENIPAMSLVYFSGADTVSLATSDPANLNEKTPVGIIQEALPANQIGVLTQAGDITYDQWDWTAAIGKAVYSNSSGQLTAVRPAGLLAYRVGFVKNKNTIVFNIDAETQPQVYNASPSSVIISGTAPITAVESTNGIGERVVTIAMPSSTTTTPGFMTAAQALALTGFDTRITSNELAINGLQTNKANVNHTHIPSDVIGLQALLDGKMAANKLFDDRYALIAHNHDGRYALAVHTHIISDVSGLQGSLDSKSDRFTGLLSFNRIYATINQTGAVDGGVGQTLADVLANKAAVSHTHAMTDITGLVDELNNRAMLNHTHSIAQVTGLQTALNNLTADIATKANVTHTHAIGDVTGLQAIINGINTALAGKSDDGHTHEATDIINLADFVTSMIIAGENITLEVGGDTITINASIPDVELPDPLHVIGRVPTGSTVTFTNRGGGVHRLTTTGSGTALFTNPGGSMPGHTYNVILGSGSVTLSKPSGNREQFVFADIGPGGMTIDITAADDLAAPTTYAWTTGPVATDHADVTYLSFKKGFTTVDNTGIITIDANVNVSDLGDVDLTNQPNDGEALLWNAGESKWVPGAVSGGEGGTSLTIVDVPDQATTMSYNFEAYVGYHIKVSNGNGVATVTTSVDVAEPWNFTVNGAGDAEVEVISPTEQRFTFTSLTQGHMCEVIIDPDDHPEQKVITTTFVADDQSVTYENVDSISFRGGQVTAEGVSGVRLTIPTKIQDLNDVNWGYGPQPNYTLVYTSGTFQPKPMNLTMLGDVDAASVGSPVNGALLKYDDSASRWVASTGGFALKDLSDVSDFYSGGTGGEILAYTGSEWQSSKPANIGLLSNARIMEGLSPNTELSYQDGAWDQTPVKTILLLANPASGTPAVATTSGFDDDTQRQLILPTDSLVRIVGQISAFQASTGFAKTWNVTGLAKSVGGTLSWVAATPAAITPDVSDGTVGVWDVTASLDATNKAVAFTCNPGPNNGVKFAIRLSVTMVS